MEDTLMAQKPQMHWSGQQPCSNMPLLRYSRKLPCPCHNCTIAPNPASQGHCLLEPRNLMQSKRDRNVIGENNSSKIVETPSHKLEGRQLLAPIAILRTNNLTPKASKTGFILRSKTNGYDWLKKLSWPAVTEDPPKIIKNWAFPVTIFLANLYFIISQAESGMFELPMKNWYRKKLWYSNRW